MLTAAPGSSGAAAVLGVQGEGLDQSVKVSGSAYRQARLQFPAPADGRVTMTYRLGPQTAYSWATIDNAALTPTSTG